MCFADDGDAATQTAVKQENQASSKADGYTEQQVSEHNGQQRDDERNKLRPAIPPHLTEDLRISQSEPNHNKDCCKR